MPEVELRGNPKTLRLRLQSSAQIVAVRISALAESRTRRDHSLYLNCRLRSLCSSCEKTNWRPSNIAMPKTLAKSRTLFPRMLFPFRRCPFAPPCSKTAGHLSTRPLGLHFFTRAQGLVSRIPYSPSLSLHRVSIDCGMHNQQQSAPSPELRSVVSVMDYKEQQESAERSGCWQVLSSHEPNGTTSTSLLRPFGVLPLLLRCC